VRRISTEEFHARSLAALEKTRGLRDDAGLRERTLSGIALVYVQRRVP
jgi:hypothetical protein